MHVFFTVNTLPFPTHFLGYAETSCARRPNQDIVEEPAV